MCFFQLVLVSATSVYSDVTRHAYIIRYADIFFAIYIILKGNVRRSRQFKLSEFFGKSATVHEVAEL